MQEPDPEKYHVLTPEKKKVVRAVAFVFFIVFLPIFSFFYYKFAVLRPSQTEREFTYEIKRGASILQVSNDLAVEEIINSRFLFNLYIFANNFDKSIQAGVYTIPAGTSIVGLVDMFQHGVVDIKITFLEGWRIEEFAIAASERFKDIDYEEFVKQARPFEGYLFPDTYLFTKDIEEDEMITILRDTFDEKTSELLTVENLSKVSLTKNEAVLFASIIEREVVSDEDRRKVAGILVKRWNEGISIGADATVQYFAAPMRDNCHLRSIEVCPIEADAAEFDWWPKNLTVEELELDNLYNTRSNLGLPPTPISNASLSALETVINLETTEYYYYLNDSEGNTHFAVTLEEHNENVANHISN